jgi:hypothetical protein
MAVVTMALKAASAINCRQRGSRWPERQPNRHLSRAYDTPRVGGLATLAKPATAGRTSRQRRAALEATGAGDFIRERNEANTPTGVGVRVLGLQSACYCLHLRRRAFDRYPGFHPTHDAQKPCVARRAIRKTRAAVRRPHIPRCPEGSRRVGHHEVVGHDTDHAPVAAFDRHGAIDDPWIGAEGLPEVMTQHDDRFAAGRLPRRDRCRAFEFVRMKRAAKPWLTTIDVEETARNMRPLDRRAAVASPRVADTVIEEVIASNASFLATQSGPFLATALVGDSG